MLKLYQKDKEANHVGVLWPGLQSSTLSSKTPTGLVLLFFVHSFSILDYMDWLGGLIGTVSAFDTLSQLKRQFCLRCYWRGVCVYSFFVLLMHFQ